MDPISGSCHCGGVRFEITGRAGPMGHCHCSRCRKATGAAYHTLVLVRRRYLRWLSGRELVAAWQPPPPFDAVRSFCRRCGCSLGDLTSDGDPIPVSAAILDGDPGRHPGGHEWVGSMAPWYEIEDALPRFDEGFPAELVQGVSRG